VQFLLNPLQNLNPKNRFGMKQTSQVWCLFTYMNMKRKQTRPEFKQFQRLPDWPIIIRPTGAERSLEETTLPKAQMAAMLVKENRFGIRSLAE